MKTTTWILCTIAVAALLLAAFSYSSSGQSTPAPEGADGRGRYQIAATTNNGEAAAYLLDTRTGRCWRYIGGYSAEVTPNELKSR